MAALDRFECRALFRQPQRAFALLITFIGTLVIIYAGQYFKGDSGPWRFFAYILLFMGAMLTGAILGLKKNDLKAVLAYSTICQLGILMMMIGQDMEISFKALIIGIFAHALYKSALFLVVGIVDHETGTRDLRRLGGLRRTMPFTFAIGVLAALSMAGLPPLFGFDVCG